MHLYRVLAGIFSQVRFGQYVGIFNDQFRQFLLYQQLSYFKHCIIFYFRKSAFFAGIELSLHHTLPPFESF